MAESKHEGVKLGNRMLLLGVQYIFVVSLEWFHVKHGEVGWFAGWLFESVVSSL